MRGHGPSREEIAGDPVRGVLALKVIGIVPMSEDMHKELTLRLQPSGNPFHQLAVVLHVLEHLHRNGPIIGAGLGGRKSIHVRRNDPYIEEFTTMGFSLDVEALRVGVGNGSDGRVGIMLRHPESQGAPTASKFEDLLPVLEFRALTGEIQHRLLGLGKGRGGGRPIPAAVLQPGAEDVEV